MLSHQRSSFGFCKCFLSQSIYLPKFSLYVEYFDDDEKFKKDYESAIPKNEIESSLQDTKKEINRRIMLRENVLDRIQLVKERYTPLHPNLYYFNAENVFQKDMKVTKVGKEVFSMPVFTPSFAEKFLEEVQHFKLSKLSHEQPNSMNRHGVLLDEIGFQEFIDHIREEFIQPQARKLFNEPDLILDSHKAFIVKYALDEDTELADHFDNAEITLNVALSQDYEGGELVFNSYSQTTGLVTSRIGYEHKFCHGVLHRGSHNHQALPITSGERWNLIIWARSSEFRANFCPMCRSIPKVYPASPGTYGDGFRCLDTTSATCNLN